jgi:hypothetical protein
MQNGGAIKKNKAMQYNIACYPGAAGAVVWVLSVWGFVYYIQPDILLRLPCTAYVGIFLYSLLIASTQIKSTSIPSPKLFFSTPRPLFVVGVPRFVLE